METHESLYSKVVLSRKIGFTACIAAIILVSWMSYERGSEWVSDNSWMKWFTFSLIFAVYMAVQAHERFSNQLFDLTHPRPPPPINPHIRKLESMELMFFGFALMLISGFSLFVAIYLYEKLPIVNFLCLCIMPVASWLMYRCFAYTQHLEHAQEDADWELNQQVKNV